MKKWLAAVVVLAVTGILVGMVMVPAIAQGGGEAQIPTTIGYQGYLTDSGGIPIEDPVNIIFALYSGASGGTPVWSESHNGVDPDNGLFTVELGSSGTPILASQLAGDRWLGVKVGADSEMTPRQKLASVGFALRADETNNANTLDNLDSADILKQDIRDFVVASGKSVTAGGVVSLVNGYAEKYTEHLNTPVCGPDYTFRQGGLCESVSSAALSDSKFIVAFNDSDNYGNVFIGNISNMVIDREWDYFFNAAYTGDLSVAALSDSTFIVAYTDSDNSAQGTVVIGEISDSGITLGPEYVFNPADTSSCIVTPLDLGRFVVTYRDVDNSNYGTAIVGEYSGNTITGSGSETVFNSEATSFMSASKLSESKFVVAYEDSGAPRTYGTARIGNISGTSINFGPEFVFNADGTAYISTAALTDSRFVVAYQKLGDSAYYSGAARVGNVSGSTISYGVECVFNADQTEAISVASLTDSKFVVAYEDRGNSDYGTVAVGEDFGGGMAMGFAQKIVFDAKAQGAISVVAVRPDKFVLAGIEDSTYHEADGEAIVGQIGLYPNIVGISGESKGSGETVPVIINGISDVHSGLTPGTLYYSDMSGNLSANPSYCQIGRSVSSTDILLTPFDHTHDSWVGNYDVSTIGKVGIGTSDTDRPLTIQSSGPQSELVSFKTTWGDTQWHINMNGSAGLNFVETDVPASRLFFEPGGNVGIGTTNPASTLEVSGTMTANDLVVNEDALIIGDTYVNTFIGERGSIHYGNTGIIGQASIFNPDVSNNGLWIEGTHDGESGGIFMNGDTMCLWSPGDNDILRVMDEDSLDMNRFVIGGSYDIGIYGNLYDLNNTTLTIDDNLDVTGALSKASGSFKIDHPLDPENKYLYHSFVESPDMMNIYNGNAVLDENGEAAIQLPEWFEALNRDFRYQLTCIGGFAPVYVAEEVSGNQFRIAGGEPGMKVSWQVTGIRQDEWANAHRVQVEVEKPAEKKGLYLYPEVFGFDETRGINYHSSQEQPKGTE